ncbi:MAG: endo-1,4-beta-xylanase, partial [Victivallaceae bacterium]|nr:endo-1,4-beta-xylanase [Victivallaceae bacterium]
MKHISRKMLAVFLFTALAAGCSAPAKKHFDVKKYEYAMDEKYLQQWNAEENARIDRDIEKYRKADGVFALDVPAGTVVQVEQTRHAFFFGAHIFDFDQLPSDEANEKYKAMWKGLFNSATIPFYWKDYEPEPGFYRDDITPDNTPEFWQSRQEPHKERFYRKPPIKVLLDFCDANHIRKHGHPLVWGCNKCLPAWYWEKLPKEITGSEFFKKNFQYNDPATKTLGWTNYWCVTGDLTEEQFAEKYPDYCKFVNDSFMDRVVKICDKYGDRFDSWDVVNESVVDTMPREYLGNAPRMVPGGKITKSIYGAMPGDYVYRSFEVAAAHLPDRAWLNINDVPYQYKNALYVKQIKDLLARGAKIDVIGCQLHILRAS